MSTIGSEVQEHWCYLNEPQTLSRHGDVPSIADLQVVRRLPSSFAKERRFAWFAMRRINSRLLSSWD